MSTRLSRRNFIFSGAAALAATRYLSGTGSPKSSSSASFPLAKSPFKIAVITDEISQDFGHACEVAAQEFGMGWVEIRELWKKNLMALDAKEIAEARRILEQHHLRVSDLATPLFKVDWAGAPLPKFRQGVRDSF